MSDLWERIRDSSMARAITGLSAGLVLFTSVGCSTNQVERYRDYGSIGKSEKVEEKQEQSQKEKLKKKIEEGKREELPSFPKPGVTYTGEELQRILEKRYEEEEEDVELELLEYRKDDKDFFEVRYRYTRNDTHRQPSYVKEWRKAEDPQDRPKIEEAQKKAAKYVAQEIVEEYPGFERFLEDVEDLTEDVQETVKGYTHYKIPEENLVEEDDKREDSSPSIRPPTLLDILKNPFEGGEVGVKPENDGVEVEGIEIEFEKENYRGGNFSIELEQTLDETELLFKWKAKF